MKATWRNRIITILFSILLIQTATSSMLIISAAAGVEYVEFRVEQVFWGTSPEKMVRALPGDINVPLTLVVRNLDNEKTIKGVYAKLHLKYPFKDSNGNMEAEAIGRLWEGGYSQLTGEIPPAASFTLTFILRIDPNAKHGSYENTLVIYYKVKRAPNNFTDGVPQILKVNIPVYNRPPIIDSFTPLNSNPVIYVNDQFNFTVKGHDPDGDRLSFEWLIDGVTVSTSNTFTYAPTVRDIGLHTVEVKVSDGDLTISHTWRVSVERMKVTNIIVRDNTIIGGLRSKLNITVKSNVWKGMVKITFNSQHPLVTYGNTTWIFHSVKPGEAVSIYPEVYAPKSLIGSTIPASLTILYNDENGRRNLESKPVGLIVKGLIRLVVYDVEVSPRKVNPGSTVTITATLLNKGNIDASYVNASIEENPILLLSSASKYYIESLGKGSPEPFSVRALVKSNVKNGTYPVTIKITYQDDQLKEHSITVSARITVEKTSSSKNVNVKSEEPLITFLKNGGWPLIILAATTIAAIILYTWTRRSSVPEQEMKGS